ncbi:MAG TPA: hypothetical protein VFO01_18510 [Trebonia sp.]|nr:hypothetical protein [Trebonia sp.]
MTLAARAQAAAAAWELVPRRNPVRFAYWLAARWQDLAGGQALAKDLRGRLALAKGERILASAPDTAGACALVATERALYHRDRNDWQRQGWERVSTVDWDAAGRRLVFTGLTDLGLGPQRSDLALRDRGSLVELARERITHTRLGRWPLMLPGGEPAVVEARRRPVTGELLWLVHLDGICWDIRDHAVHASITKAIVHLGADLGIPAQVPLDSLTYGRR